VSDQFKRLKRANEHAAKEKQVLEWVIPIIEGEIPDGRCRAGGVSFNNLDPLTDGILKPANPDIYYGARPEELSRNVRNELSGQIIPSTQHDLPMVPNFFVEAKGPDGSVAVAKRQACYNGALGARGMHSLQSYGKPPVVYDNNAYTVTSTYHDGNLKLYTSHIAPPRSPGHHPVYYMTQLEGYSMTGSQRSFIEGATAYRNVRDWAKKRRDEAIQNANAKEANPTKADAVAEDGGAILAASFTTALDTDEAYTVTQEVFRPSPDNADAYQESDSSEDATVYTSPAKRPKYKGQKRPRRKRHNADVSSCAGHSYGSALTPVSQDAVVGSVTTKQNERWP
jgi:hypothetical protein